MSGIPEGVTPVSVEASDLKAAVLAAAGELGVAYHQVGHKIDMSHFRSSTGVSVAKSTVKIFAWIDPDAPEEAPAKPEPKKAAKSEPRGERKAKNDGDREDRPRRGRGKKAPAEDEVELTETESATWASEWLRVLLGHMDLTGTVAATGNDNRVRLAVTELDKPGRLVGKRGTTLGAVRHLLACALQANFDSSYIIDVDIPDGRERGGRGDRKERGERGERGDRGKRQKRDRKGTFPEEKLQALARRAADKALESGKKFTVNLELNSFDRRTIHMAIAEIEGVTTVSKEREDGTKVVQIIPESALLTEDTVEA